MDKIRQALKTTYNYSDYELELVKYTLLSIASLSGNNLFTLMQDSFISFSEYNFFISVLHYVNIVF